MREIEIVEALLSTTLRHFISNFQRFAAVSEKIKQKISNEPLLDFQNQFYISTESYTHFEFVSNYKEERWAKR